MRLSLVASLVLVLVLVACTTTAQGDSPYSNRYRVRPTYYPTPQSRAVPTEPVPKPPPPPPPPPPPSPPPKPKPGHDKTTYPTGKPDYSYAYGIEDWYEDVKVDVKESRDGQNTAGEYITLLPDGRTQKVTYTVDGKSGFVADVTYEGIATHPVPTKKPTKPWKYTPYMPKTPKTVKPPIPPIPTYRPPTIPTKPPVVKPGSYSRFPAAGVQYGYPTPTSYPPNPRYDLGNYYQDYVPQQIYQEQQYAQQPFYH